MNQVLFDNMGCTDEVLPVGLKVSDWHWALGTAVSLDDCVRCKGSDSFPWLVDANEGLQSLWKLFSGGKR